MGRIMAIDYGSKRVGVAVTDSLKIIANGLTTVDRKDIMKFLENYFKKEEVECLVVGDPRRFGMDDTMAEQADKFSEHLKKKFPGLKIDRMNEMYTSKMAFQTMIDSGLKKEARKNKGLIDEISATIILQSYMEAKK